MAVVVGNIALLLDGTHVTTPRAVVLPDRKTRDVLLNFFVKKDPCQNQSMYISSGFENERERVNPKVGFRGKANSKVGAVDYENSSDDENGNGVEDEGEGGEGGGEEFDWEKEMKRRVKELEEMKELEKKAEELQNRVDEEYGEEDEISEETEEEKRERVRRELEKVAQEQSERRKTAQLMFDLGQKASTNLPSSTAPCGSTADAFAVHKTQSQATGKKITEYSYRRRLRRWTAAAEKYLHRIDPPIKASSAPIGRKLV